MEIIGGNLRHKMVEIPRQARDTEFYNQVEDLGKIRGRYKK
mgnify:CR=1 FL=1